MKLKLSSLITTIAAITIVNAVTPVSGAPKEDGFNVFLYALLGPTKASPNYNTWSTNAVWELSQTKSLAGNLSGKLIAEYLTQATPDLTNDTLWFAVRVVSKDPANKFSLSQLQFVERSSDSGNSLASSYTLSTITNLIYSQRAIGIIWGSGGAGSSSTILDYNDGTIPVNEICLIGMESPYFQYSVATVSNFISSFTNFMVTATCQVVGTDGIIVASAQKTLQTVGNTMPPVLSIVDLGTNVLVGFNMETNRTAVIRSSTDVTIPFANWTLEATVNSGDALSRAKTDQYRFYRARIE